MIRMLSERPVRCPFCDEPITLLVDVSAGSQQYIEDCQVCCRPMQVVVVADEGNLESVHVDCAS